MFESKGLKKLALDVIQGVLVEELLMDADIVQSRRSICGGSPGVAPCEEMDRENEICNKCGCFLQIKTQSKVNKKLSGGSEITHCPLNKWLDEFSQLGYKLKNDTIKS